MTDLSMNTNTTQSQAPSPALASTADTAPFRIGSEEHKRAFCGVLLDIFDPYKPGILNWPKLSDDAQSRLTGLPFWDIAVETEGYASSRMQAMADTIQDPLIKQALSLNAFEEGRHKLVIRNMLRFYGIPLKPEQPYRPSGDPEGKFIETGYGECLDSFFSFGLFKMAKDSGFFPPELVDVFEPVVFEEARHIMFFVNWVAWSAANKSFLPRLWFRFRCLKSLAAAGLGRLTMANMGDDGAAGDNFVVSGGKSLAEGLSLRKLIEMALSEDTRRMSIFNSHLLRPTLMPFVGRMILSTMKLFRIA